MLYLINIILKNLKKQALGQSFKTFNRSIYSHKFAFVKKILPPSLTQGQLGITFSTAFCTIQHSDHQEQNYSKKR